MGYIITAEKQGFKYYYHGNTTYPQFYWNIWSTPTRYLRVYKNKKTAENVMKRITPKMRNYKLSIEEN